MPRTHFETDWALGDRVYIDGDTSLKATVTGFAFTALSHTARIEWIHGGESKHDYIQFYRLSKVE